MADHYTPPADSPEPFSGDRGWSGLARSPGEGAAFAMVLALVVLMVLAGLAGGITGLLLLFVLLTFATLAVLIVISVGG